MLALCRPGSRRAVGVAVMSGRGHSSNIKPVCSHGRSNAAWSVAQPVEKSAQKSPPRQEWVDCGRVAGGSHRHSTAPFGDSDSIRSRPGGRGLFVEHLRHRPKPLKTRFFCFRVTPRKNPGKNFLDARSNRRYKCSSNDLLAAAPPAALANVDLNLFFSGLVPAMTRTNPFNNPCPPVRGRCL